jgi:hypothetical protein
MSHDKEVLLMSDPVLSSLPGRINDLEQQAHTLAHRMRALEEERLPTRVTTLEMVVASIRVDVTAIERISEKVQNMLTDQALKTAIHQQKIESTLRTAAWVGSALVVLLQFLPYLKKLLM